eukprot:872278-Prorocentrum_minimum.AAC.1
MVGTARTSHGWYSAQLAWSAQCAPRMVGTVRTSHGGHSAHLAWWAVRARRSGSTARCSAGPLPPRPRRCPSGRSGTGPAGRWRARPAGLPQRTRPATVG